MSLLWQYRFIFIVLVVIISTSNVRSSKRPELINDDSNILSPDFVNFVRGLDTMVYNRNRRTTTVKPIAKRVHKKEKLRSKLRKSNLLKSSQNSALRDILMMKLVSYYEDKYKLSKHTTAKGLPYAVHTSPVPFNDRNRQLNYQIQRHRNEMQYHGNGGFLNQPLHENSVDTYMAVNTFDQNTLESNALDRNNKELSRGVMEVVAF